MNFKFEERYSSIYDVKVDGGFTISFKHSDINGSMKKYSWFFIKSDHPPHSEIANHQLRIIGVDLV